MWNSAHTKLSGPLTCSVSGAPPTRTCADRQQQRRRRTLLRWHRREHTTRVRHRDKRDKPAADCVFRGEGGGNAPPGRTSRTRCAPSHGKRRDATPRTQVASACCLLRWLRRPSARGRRSHEKVFQLRSVEPLPSAATRGAGLKWHAVSARTPPLIVVVEHRGSATVRLLHVCFMLTQLLYTQLLVVRLLSASSSSSARARIWLLSPPAGYSSSSPSPPSHAISITLPLSTRGFFFCSSFSPDPSCGDGSASGGRVRGGRLASRARRGGEPPRPGTGPGEGAELRRRPSCAVGVGHRSLSACCRGARAPHATAAAPARAAARGVRGCRCRCDSETGTRGSAREQCVTPQPPPTHTATHGTPIPSASCARRSVRATCTHARPRARVATRRRRADMRERRLERGDTSGARKC